MSYEVHYYYHERLDDGSYNKNDIKQSVKKIGKHNENVDVEQVVSSILTQFARRDVWVVDVKIYEYIKKEISFKETKGGVIIKNKKYLFDNLGAKITSITDTEQPIDVTEDEDMIVPEIVSQPVINNKKSILFNNDQPHNKMRPPKPIRNVVFSPNVKQLPLIKNFNLTKGKTYGIFKEVSSVEEWKLQHPNEKQIPPLVMSNSTVKYWILDDNNQELLILCDFFEELPPGLLFNNLIKSEEANSSTSNNLSYSDITPANMITLR